MNKILKVQNVIVDSDNRDGTKIIFTSNNEIHYGDLVSIEYDGETKYFEVAKITIGPEFSIECIAESYGHDRIYCKDIRDLVNLDISLVNDVEVIKKIRLESCWC